MLENRKETFRLLDELIGGGEDVIVEITGKDMEQVNWLANIAVNHLNSLEDDAEYVRYSEGLNSNVFSYAYDLDDEGFLYFRLDNAWDVCIEPYYSIEIDVSYQDVNEDDMITYHKIYKRNGKDGDWQEGDTFDLTQTGSAEKCAKCPRRRLCGGEF